MAFYNKRVSKRSHRRLLRIRGRIKKIASVPRVSIFRSSKYIYAQLIDHQNGNVLASHSSIYFKNIKENKTDVAQTVGKELAVKIKNIGIHEVVFDRGPYLYHGRVKALATGLREGGLKI